MVIEDFKHHIVKNATHYALEHPSNFVLIPAVITIICGVTADLLIVSTILKSRKTSSVFHFYILNWCLCDALLLIIQPYTYTAIFSLDSVKNGVACAWFGIIVAITIGNYSFVAALTMDWLYSTYFQACADKMRQVNKYQIFLIWVLVVILIVYTCCVCIVEKMSLWIFVVTTISLIMYAVVQVLWFIKRKTSSGDSGQSNLALAMVSVYFVCWIPNYLIQGIKAFENSEDMSDESNVVTSLVGYLNSGIMLILLNYCDRDFGRNFGALCSRRSDTNNVAQTENIEAK